MANLNVVDELVFFHFCWSITVINHSRVNLELKESSKVVHFLCQKAIKVQNYFVKAHRRGIKCLVIKSALYCTSATMKAQPEMRGNSRGDLINFEGHVALGLEPLQKQKLNFVIKVKKSEVWVCSRRTRGHLVLARVMGRSDAKVRVSTAGGSPAPHSTAPLPAAATAVPDFPRPTGQLLASQP